MDREMKDSAIEWIGPFPSSWTIKRIKNLALDMQRGVQPQYAEATNFFIANQACLSTYRFRSEKRKECEALEGKKGRYKPNDILIASTGEGVLGKCVLADHPGYSDSHVSILRLKESHSPAFLTYFLSVNYELVNSFFAKGSTKQTELQRGDFLAHSIAIPSLIEQRRIATWLDLQTTRIDKRRELLAKKRELLQDLKKSVIQEATFRGIARDVEMRDSEIAWLGQVPCHWTTMRIGSLFREAADDGVDGLPMLSVSIHSGISDKELDEVEMERKVSRSEDITLYKRVQPGDLVYNQMRAWQGAFGAAKIEGLVSPAYVVARPGPSVLPGFVEYLLRAPAAMEEIRRCSRGITEFRLRLYWSEFKNIRIALPPLNEQQEIVGFLDRKHSQIARQITLIDQLDDLLKQQRKALIHEAVTGKIDLSQESSFQKGVRMTHLGGTLPN